MALFFISGGLLGAALALILFLLTRFAFGPGGAAPEPALHRAARAVNWALFLVFLALASGSLDPYHAEWEPEGWSRARWALLALGAALSGAIPFGLFRRGPLGPRLASCVWLALITAMGSPLGAQILNRQFASSLRTIDAHIESAHIETIRGAPRMSATLAGSAGLAPGRLLLPAGLPISMAPHPTRRLRLVMGAGPLGDATALSAELPAR